VKEELSLADPKPGVTVAPRLTSDEAGALAQQSGLREMGIRPPLRSYVTGLWNRRSFIWNLSSSRAYVRNQGSYLGQTWTVLRPILDALTMIIIFGFVFHGSAPGIENRAAFIVIGSFSYSLFQQIVMVGLSSIPNDLQLIRSHQFPRAVVPLSAVMTESVLFGPIMIAMVVLVVLTGFLPDMGGPVIPHWSWLLLPVAAALLAVFSAGVGLFFARLGARAPDIANVVPFFLSLGRFASGATFYIAGLTGVDSWFRPILLFQPVQIFLELIRATFGNEPLIQMSPGLWLLATVYAVGAFVGGFLFFWGAEETYGRD
jgi:teichoic acid transport system permease protein